VITAADRISPRRQCKARVPDWWLLQFRMRVSSPCGEACSDRMDYPVMAPIVCDLGLAILPTTCVDSVASVLCPGTDPRVTPTAAYVVAGVLGVIALLAIRSQRKRGQELNGELAKTATPERA
jgi:hypothetical protein